MKKYIKPFLGFLFLNFLGLALGSLWTNTGISSDWYTNLVKAPWTPQGWVFGVAWTLIMISLSVWNAKVWVEKDTSFLRLYYMSWVYNLVWNPVFFHLNMLFLSLVIIVSLTMFLGILLHYTRKDYGWWSLFLFPYFIWLNIATSLNAYSFFMN
jgi:tryptophan-rich sensory protein